MYRILSDLRLLELAEYLEGTLERYEESLRDMIPEVPVRAALAPLFDAGPSHDSLKRFHQELKTRATQLKGPQDTQDVLQVLLDCEAVAHQFYLSQLDRLADPRLVTLFSGLANEERTHIQAIHAALERLKRVRKTGGLNAATPPGT